MVQTPLDARPDLGTQPLYEAPDDVGAKQVSNAVINIWLLRLLHGIEPKFAVGQ